MPEIKNSTYQKFCPTVLIFHSMYVEACFAKAAQLRKYLLQVSPPMGDKLKKTLLLIEEKRSPSASWI